MFSSLKKYELRGAKRQVRLFNRFRIESVLKNGALSHAEIWWHREIGVSLHRDSRKAALDKAQPSKLTFNNLLTL